MKHLLFFLLVKGSPVSLYIKPDKAKPVSHRKCVERECRRIGNFALGNSKRKKVKQLVRPNSHIAQQLLHFYV